MSMSSLMKRVMGLLLALSLAYGYSVPGWAGLIGTGQLMQLQSGVDRLSLVSALEREDVRRQLEALGVDPDHARQRLANLDDSQIAALQADLDSLPAGGGVLEVVVAVLVVLLILDLVGVADIFPFVR